MGRIPANDFITRLQRPTNNTLTLPTVSHPKPLTNAPIINDALTIRRKVFVDDGDFDAADEIDAEDARSWHWVIYDNGEARNPVPVATIRMVPPPQVSLNRLSHADRATYGPQYDFESEPAVRPSRMAVLKEYQGNQLAVRLMETVHSWASENQRAINHAYMHSLQAVGGNSSALPNGKWSGLVHVYGLKHLEKFFPRIGYELLGEEGFWEGVEHVGFRMRLDVKMESKL